MKLDIFDKKTGQPVITLSEDERGMKVISGDAKMVNQLGLSQFNNLKEIADAINSDPNGQYSAEGEEDKSGDQAPDLEAQLKPALAHIKELMGRVKDRHRAQVEGEAAQTAEGRAHQTMGTVAIAGLNDQIYVSLDGDNIGNAVARAEEQNDEATLSAVSGRINSGQDVLRQWAERHGGKVIEQGGDEGLVKVPRTALEDIEALRDQYKQAVGNTASVGVGNQISDSTKARMLAKLKGKNRTIIFDESVPKQIEMLMDDSQDESKKMKLAMRPDESMGAPKSITGNLNDQKAQDGSEDSSVAPEQPGAGSGSESEPSEASGAGEAKASSRVQAPLSQNLLRELSKVSSDKPVESTTGSASYDHDIENHDYSYSDDPEFAKSLRYALKYPGGNNGN